MTIVIEIPGIAHPGPAAHVGSTGGPQVLKSFAETAQQAVAHGMLPVQGTSSTVRVGLKVLLGGQPDAGSRPHVGHIQVVAAILIEIEPSGAHARAHILGTGFWRYVSERAITVVPVKVLAAEVVDHVQIGPQVVIVVAPGRAETETGVPGT